jgi:PAS domain S-box-containing protein
VSDETLLALMRSTGRSADAPPPSTTPERASEVPPPMGDLFVGTLLASAPVGICMLDGALRYRVWNDYLEGLLGVAAADVIGLRLADAPGLAQVAALADELERMHSGTPSSTREAEYRYPLGDRPWLRVKCTPVYESGHRFGGVFILLERIDRERFAESSLAALRQALESVGEMVMEVDRHGHLLDANETALKALGYERDDIKGLTLAAIDVGLDDEGFEAVYDQLRTRGAHQGEARYRTRHGTEFPVETVIQRVEQAGREFILLLSRDISARKQAEEALTESAERFRALFDESPVAALLLDSGFRVIGANHSACETVGYAVEELIGKDPESVVHADDLAAYRRMRDEMQRGAAQADTAERRLVHRDGRVVWTKSSVRSVSAGPGHRHYLIVLENFTDRKIFEEQLQVALRDQQTLFETMSVGVAQTMSGKILLANREFAEMFGYADGEVIGMPLWDLSVDRDDRMPGEVSGMPVVRPYQTTSAEIFDPATETWAGAADLPVGFYEGAAVSLLDGRVLLAAGVGADGGQKPRLTAQVYDPASDTWAPTGPLAAGHRYAAPALLPSGEVLLAGGLTWNASNNWEAVSAADLLDPVSLTWSAAAPLDTSCWGHMTAVLPSGRVLVTGGIGNPDYQLLTRAVVFDPGTNAWIPYDPMPAPRTFANATPLPSGAVLVTGGSGDSSYVPLSSSVLFTE